MKDHETEVGMGSGLFPVAHSVFSPEALLGEIATAYAIETPVTCQLLRRGLNDSYLLTTNSKRFVVRVFRARWRSPSDIAYELELLTHLAAKGVPVSVPLATRDGSLSRSLSAPEGTRQAALFTYARGRPFSWKEAKHSYLAGRLLAAIHAESEDFVSRHPRFRLDLEYLIDTPLSMIRPFLANRPEDWSYLQGLAARLRARVEAVARAGLDWGLCHGDFGANNAHIAEDQILTVFDFDFCGPGWRAYDFVMTRWGALDHDYRSIWDSFLKGYTEMRPWSEADLAAVPLFDTIRHVWGMGLRAGNARYQGTLSMSYGYLDHRFRTFRKWEAEHRNGI